jgi:AcrR family transcriptional regulator
MGSMVNELASRDRILRAAMDELAESGELEVARVARRAGVSVGLPYRYFSSRTGLLIAVIGALHERLDHAVVMRRYEAPTWRERERRRIRDWVTFLYEDPLAFVVLDGVTGDAAVADANRALLHRAIDAGTRNVAAAQRDGELPGGRDPELLAAGVLGGVHATVSVARSRSPRRDPAAVSEELWRFVAGAVGIEP